MTQFAKRAGVTVRALHHDDRLGLLKPSGRSRAGYRLCIRRAERSLLASREPDWSELRDQYAIDPRIQSFHRRGVKTHVE